ncbi:MAG: hypothetical protein CMQ40_05860 [Gammaproteobacteria bacterium]|nr:hypothetical protein [Gammaproteobacteria bacterium]|tara:strand:+ start:49 stop:720 length:672 start_codon:yes stop_codon:yes gene_type:complete
MKNTLSEKEVSDFLIRNPEFFQKKEFLLRKLKIPHKEKGTISLIEKQLEISRQREEEGRKKISQFLSNAKSNTEIFKKSKLFLTMLIEAETSEQFFQALKRGVIKHLGCTYSLIIFGSKSKTINQSTKIIEKNSLSKSGKGFLKNKGPRLGILSTEEIAEFFKEKDRKQKSFAVIPIKRKQKPIALFILGHKSKKFFDEGKETIFLEFIGDALSVLVPKYLAK